MARRPEPEVDITPTLVRRLLDEQCPHLATGDLTELSRGWANTSYLLGQDLIARLPHRQAAAELIRSEQRWLPDLADRITLTIPAPLHLGTPSGEYPWHWSIVPFVEGTEAAGAPITNARQVARALGDF